MIDARRVLLHDVTGARRPEPGSDEPAAVHGSGRVIVRGPTTDVAAGAAPGGLGADNFDGVASTTIAIAAANTASATSATHTGLGTRRHPNVTTVSSSRSGTTSSVRSSRSRDDPASIVYAGVHAGGRGVTWNGSVGVRRRIRSGGGGSGSASAFTDGAR